MRMCTVPSSGLLLLALRPLLLSDRHIPVMLRNISFMLKAVRNNALGVWASIKLSSVRFTHVRHRSVLTGSLSVCAQDGLREKVGPGAPRTKIRSAPFVQIPLGVTEDRLVGTVDIEASMKVHTSSF